MQHQRPALSNRLCNHDSSQKQKEECGGILIGMHWEVLLVHGPWFMIKGSKVLRFLRWEDLNVASRPGWVCHQTASLHDKFGPTPMFEVV